jgi:hypothetical protein
MKIIFGIILSVIGASMSIYNEKVFGMFGRVPFAEKYFESAGGSRLFYVALGVITVFIGFTLIFNLYDQLMSFILGPLIRTQI